MTTEGDSTLPAPSTTSQPRPQQRLEAGAAAPAARSVDARMIIVVAGQLAAAAAAGAVRSVAVVVTAVRTGGRGAVGTLGRIDVIRAVAATGVVGQLVGVAVVAAWQSVAVVLVAAGTGLMLPLRPLLRRSPAPPPAQDAPMAPAGDGAPDVADGDAAPPPPPPPLPEPDPPSEEAEPEPYVDTAIPDVGFDDDGYDTDSEVEGLVFSPFFLAPPPARTDDPRAWPVKAANVLIGSLAGVLAVIMVLGALGPRVVNDLAGAVEVSLVLPENTQFGGLAERSVIYAADGSVLSILHGEVDRNPVSINQIPDHVWQAVIASEDRRFFEHEGYDVEGFGRALLANIRARGVAEGGSTITQQLAKMNFVGDEETLQRKLSELVYAVKLERDSTKEELLERYLNQVYFGAGTYGVQAAAEEYFRVNVGDLTPDQAALLAGIIPNPSARNPRVDPDGAREARDSVLDAMAAEGYLTERELPVLKAQPVDVAPARPDLNREPYVIEAVKREFFNNPAFGATRQERIDRLFQGGLDIHTTIEPRLQEIAEEVVEDYYPEGGGPTSAIAALEPGTGAIKAIHSGQDFNTEQYDIATQGRRQPGSAFKTFVLAEALSQGFPPDLTLDGSSPLEVVYDEGRRTYEPQNYGGASYGDIDMRTALRNSVNTYFVQLFMLVGEEKAVEMAGEMGIDVPAAIGSRSDYGPSLTLGGLLNGVTPLEMASAYSMFANEGVRAEPFLIDRVVHDGDDVLSRQSQERRVLDADVNGVAVDMLRAVVDGGTGTRARLPGWQVAGKTGTTNDNTDAWFVGATPVMSTAVWVGHPDGQVEMPGATGGTTAAPIWQDFMSRALEDVDPVPFPDYETPSFTGAEVDVPDVRGLTQTEALQELAELRLVADARSVNSHAPAGRVIWQDPGPSETSNVGRTVVIGVSNGVPPPPPPEPEPEETSEPEPENTDSDGEQPDGGEPEPEQTDGDGAGGEETDGGDTDDSDGGDSDGGDSDGGDSDGGDSDTGEGDSADEGGDSPDE